MNPYVVVFIALLAIFMLSNELATIGHTSRLTRRLFIGLRTSCLVTALLTFGEMTILSMTPVLFLSAVGVTTLGGLLAPVSEGSAA